MENYNTLNDMPRQIRKTVHNYETVPYFSTLELFLRISEESCDVFCRNPSKGGRRTGILKREESDRKFSSHENTIRKLRSSGETVANIGKIIGFHKASVYRYMQRKGIK